VLSSAGEEGNRDLMLEQAWDMDSEVVRKDIVAATGQIITSLTRAAVECCLVPNRSSLGWRLRQRHPRR